ncbi:hypothetical protein NQ317_015737 [Molorchus minor]|uniref:Uncharacterized protein n=1 Tax=Molorchus minor TaxID=1323400 RepID=A0ABQ9JB07_9CUCU|nr:hypothetical protein NQ317_015737 [Molorchus minor]
MYLGLPDPSSYTKHCLRRISATAPSRRLEKFEGVSTVAEGYLEESLELKNNTARFVFYLTIRRGRHLKICINLTGSTCRFNVR